MKLRNFINFVVPYIPAFISLLGCIFIIWGLENWIPKDTLALDKIDTILGIICITSIFLVIVLFIFILNKTNQLRFSSNTLSTEINTLTQKIHHFRNIVDILVRSEVWTTGLKEYIDKEFGDLNYFTMKEFYKGRSKLALEYIEENNRYGDSENLYLEAKSLLLNDPSNSKVETFSNPRTYSPRILKKWVEHKCGSGIWYYFGYKYASYKDELDVNRIFERHQEKILSYAVQLDTHRYQDMGFSEDLLSKLGEQMSEEIIPRLFSITMQSQQRVPRIINFTFILLALLTVFGIFLPIGTLLFQLPLLYSFISIGLVCSILLFMTLSIYPFVIKEINTGR
ncbi:hypothetical protein [Dokdonia sp.]|uniref:hypothetical protein n=1 Tax=Dokdonia sp. TaxID=2024995 RepID=UPI00326307EB